MRKGGRREREEGRARREREKLGKRRERGICERGLNIKKRNTKKRKKIRKTERGTGEKKRKEVGEE